MLWLLVLLYIAVATAQAATDCSVRPQHSKLTDCCKFPLPKWENYAAECSKYSNGFNKLSNPCIIDCAFNVSQVLENDVLNVANARTMISKLYAGNPEFIQTFNLGFDKCQARIKQKMDQFKNTERTSPPMMRGPSNCRTLPMLYAMCSHKEAFANCPASAWTSSPACENAKNYALNCDNDALGGKGGKRSRFFKALTATG